MGPRSSGLELINSGRHSVKFNQENGKPKIELRGDSELRVVQQYSAERLV